MFDYVINGSKNVFRKKMRSILTMAGIAIGVVSVIVISTIGEIGKNTINREIDNIGMSGLTVRTIKSASRLFTTQLNEVKELDSVSDAMPLMLEYTESSMRGLKTDCAVWGIDHDAQKIVSMKLLHGRYINKSDVASNASVCIVDGKYAQKIYKRTNIVGKTMRISMNGRQELFRVIGVVETGGTIMQSLIGSYVPCFVYIPYTTLKSYTGKSNFDQIAVKLKPDRDPNLAAKEIKSSLSAVVGSSNNIRVENLVAQREQLDKILEIVTLVLSIIAGISLVVAGLSIMTVMMVSVSERTREIGIKKSIGASRCKIMMEFLTESFLISGIGSLAGLAVGVIFSALGCAAAGIPPLLNRGMILFSVLFATGIGILFGVYPAMQAAKLRPVDALRSDI